MSEKPLEPVAEFDVKIIEGSQPTLCTAEYDSAVTTSGAYAPVFIDRTKKIDFNKVNSLEDVVTILRAMDIAIWDDGSFGEMQHLLRDPE